MRSTASLAALGLAVLVASPARAQSAALVLAIATPGHREFGFDVAAAGDLNGDGRPDYVVGSPGQSGLPGVVYAYSGATAVLLRTFPSPAPRADARFGDTVLSAGDVSGDGVGDLLVGEPDTDGTFFQEGHVYVLNGGTGALIRTLSPPAGEEDGNFGIALSAGDVTGDGATDYLVGANRGGPFTGQAFLFNGATGALLLTFNSPTPLNGGRFGTAVAVVDDFNGDGTRDVLVGAPYEGAAGPFPGGGKAYLFSGATGVLLRTFDSPGTSQAGQFGRAIEPAGDRNGDGRGEWLVGAPGEFRAGSSQRTGKAYLLDLATGAALATFVPPTGQGQIPGTFGAALASVGDLSGDGVADVLVGDPTFTDDAIVPPLQPGRAHLYDGATGDELFTFRSTMEQEDGEFGSAVAGLGDVDGDGAAEMLVGAHSESLGRAHLYRAVAGVVLRPGGLITEYVEGSGFNRAIEIYNDTDAPLDLAAGAYSVRVYGNGAPVPGATIPLTGTLAPGDVLVVADDRADAAILAAADLTTSALVFNGNDAVGLFTGNDLLDLIGEIGTDPGTEWGTGLASTADNTLRREGDSCQPDPDSTGAFVPSERYVGYPLDTFGGLGAVGLACGPTVTGGGPAASSPLALAVVPNPARGRVAVTLALPDAGAVSVAVYDAVGRRVAVLHDGPLAAGAHALALDVSALAPGVYVVRATAGGAAAAGRLVEAR